MQDISIATSLGQVEIHVENELLQNVRQISPYNMTTSKSQLRRTVRVSLNGEPQVEQSRLTHVLPGVHSVSQQIWHFYEQAHRGNLVIRTGFGLCGCYDLYDPAAGPNPRHPESVTEHANGCLTLSQCLRFYYPHLLDSSLAYNRLDYLLKYHDLGENSYSDHPDDGSQNVIEKDTVELAEFVLAIYDLPEPIRSTIIDDFIAFQNVSHQTKICQEAKSSPETDLTEQEKIVQLARAIDKCEAILSGAFYEKSGICGDLAYKNSHFGKLTALDRYFIRQTGDSTITSSWFAHTLHDDHALYGFRYVMDIIRAAIIDIRGEWFPWFDGFCQRHNIPYEHIRHLDA